jgi:TPR repeat protein
MHLRGWGVPAPDATAAASHFSAAARAGHLLAGYNLAALHLRGAAGERSAAARCEAAARELKRVAERGWPALEEADEDLAAGAPAAALVGYLRAAEAGLELGQSNAAWLLGAGLGGDPGARAGAVAAALLARAAAQGNAAALVKLGDAWWAGTAGGPPDWARAAAAYAEAGRQRVAQALFNLGWMHAHGAGAARDAALAKRYYDRAAEASPDARLAARLALAALRVQVAWGRLLAALPPRAAALASTAAAPVARLAGPPASPAAASAAAAAARRARSRGRARGLELPSLARLLDALDAATEGPDAPVALGLAVLLALVLRRRGARRRERAGGAAAGAAGAAAGGAAAAEPPPPRPATPAAEEPQLHAPAAAPAAAAEPAAVEPAAEPAAAPAAAAAPASDDEEPRPPTPER